jgi:hypothetical protein
MRYLLIPVLVFSAHAADIAIIDLSKLTLQKTKGEIVTYKGKKALQLVREAGDEGQDAMAIVKGAQLGDGELEIELSGEPGKGAAAAARGFVGIAFRVIDDGKKFECIYLRPTNGRADDQIRRNHSVQYESIPEFPWFRMRKEFPEKYETYVDLEPGVWTKYKLVIAGKSAKLYVHGGVQPTLIVNDLRLDAATGGIGLWAGPGTLAHFANLRITGK